MEPDRIYSEMEKAFAELDNLNYLYKPTSFWCEASKEIYSEIMQFGMDNFRSLSLPLSYFVPTYSSPGNSLNKEIEDGIINLLGEMNVNQKQYATINNFLNGTMHAISDYRAFIASDDTSKKPFLHHFSESSYGNPREQFVFDNRKFSRSAFNYLLGLVFFKKFARYEELKNVLEIGGGFGTLGEILKTSGINDYKYINFDIPPTSYISWNYLYNVYNDEINPIHSMLKNDKLVIAQLKPCNVFNNWQIENLDGVIDLFVNFISFQEMEPPVVLNYINHVKRLNAKWMLLRNIREGKQKKSNSNEVGVEHPIKKEDYIRMIEDSYELISTNVIPYGFKTVDGFHSELLLFKLKGY